MDQPVDLESYIDQSASCAGIAEPGAALGVLIVVLRGSMIVVELPLHPHAVDSSPGCKESVRKLPISVSDVRHFDWMYLI